MAHYGAESERRHVVVYALVLPSAHLQPISMPGLLFCVLAAGYVQRLASCIRMGKSYWQEALQHPVSICQTRGVI